MVKDFDYLVLSGIPQTQNKYDEQLISSSSSNSKLTMPPTPPGQRKSSRPMSVFSSSNKGRHRTKSFFLSFTFKKVKLINNYEYWYTT